MLIVLLVVAVVVGGVPLVAAVLVTIASLREDAGHTLTGRAPNWLDAAARRLLSFGPSRTTGRSARRVPRTRPPAGSSPRGVRGVVPPGQRRLPDDNEGTRPLTGPRA
jgi:hypothetical protein